MSNALATVSTDEWAVMTQQGEMLVKTGFLPVAIKTKEQAVAVMLKGRELGIPPMHALSSIVVIQGKPTCSAELMLALIYRDHGDDAVMFTTSTTTACSVAYKRRSWSQRQTYSFTMDDAKRAGVTGNQTWSKYPAAMLRARAISAVARMAFPDTIGGMYTSEEMGAQVTVNSSDEIVAITETIPRDDDAPIRSIVEVLTDEIAAEYVTDDGEIVEMQTAPAQPDNPYFDTDNEIIYPRVTENVADDVKTCLDLLQHSKTSKQYRQAKEFVVGLGLHSDPEIANLLGLKDEAIAFAKQRRSAPAASDSQHVMIK